MTGTRWHVELAFDDGSATVFELRSDGLPTAERLAPYLRGDQLVKASFQDVRSLPTLGPIGTNG